MPSLIDIRRRIRSVKNTQQITRAMKMVSAAKLRRAQDRVISSRPYGSLLRKVLGNVASAVAGDEQGPTNALLARRPEQRILLVLITGDLTTTIPRSAREQGFEGVACVDDAARAIVMYCQIWRRWRSPVARLAAHRLLGFLAHMQAAGLEVEPLEVLTAGVRFDSQ